MTCISPGGSAGPGELLASWKLLSFPKKKKKKEVRSKKFLFSLDQNQIIYVFFKPLRSQCAGKAVFQPALLDSFIGLCHNKSEVRRNRKALLSNNRGWGSGKGGPKQRQACWAAVLPDEDKMKCQKCGWDLLGTSLANQGASLESGAARP